MTRKTHVLGVIGRKQAEKTRLEAGRGKWKRKVGAGADILSEKTTKWVWEEKSRLENPD